MGMFDSVYVNCPKCNYQTEIQSKNGDCTLDKYNINNIEEIPESILEDMANKVHTCDECNENFTIEIKYKIIKIPIKSITKLL